MALKNEIMVSVNCITYNHESYIAEAIDSFLMQETGFNYEILIHDDASTDKTAEIIREYEKKYPDIIKPIYQTENQYSKGGDVDELNTERAVGKYIALCEGDDFWTDSHKLQKQVEYLEAHSECTMCAHAAYAVNVMGKKEKNIRPSIGNKNFTIEEIIEGGGGLFATNSIMYPTLLDRNKPSFYKTAPVGDYPLAVHLALKGTVYYIDEFMSAYRKGDSGSWTNREMTNLNNKIKHLEEISKMLEEINQYTDYKYQNAIRKIKDKMQFNIMIKQGRFKELKLGNYKVIYDELENRAKTEIFFLEHFPNMSKTIQTLKRKNK